MRENYSQLSLRSGGEEKKKNHYNLEFENMFNPKILLESQKRYLKSCKMFHCANIMGDQQT